MKKTTKTTVAKSATKFFPKKITVYQGGGEYPSLHIMVVDNPVYHGPDKLISTDPDEIAERTRTWLKKQLAKKPPPKK